GAAEQGAAEQGAAEQGAAEQGAAEQGAAEQGRAGAFDLTTLDPVCVSAPEAHWIERRLCRAVRGGRVVPLSEAVFLDLAHLVAG
ncbi:hypothetical protein, partial [Virgisporangium ochraceum]|uniref:hypothetical protein n=1 Tax=Virgisporangium ochraceum TaxID=65505 RepID=UPI0019451493